jgi:hypothetical protein
MDMEKTDWVEEEEGEEGNIREEVASQASNKSRKSDMATNTDAVVTAIGPGAVTAREQDPYRACRKLPLPRHVHIHLREHCFNPDQYIQRIQFLAKSFQQNLSFIHNKVVK